MSYNMINESELKEFLNEFKNQLKNDLMNEIKDELMDEIKDYINENIDNEFKEIELKEKIKKELVDTLVKSSIKNSVAKNTSNNLFLGARGFSFGSMLKGETVDFDSQNQNINGITKNDLIDNPVEDYDEFVRRVKILDPKTSDEAIEQALFNSNHNCNDIDFLNKLILAVYDKALERKLEKELDKDFSDYKGKNLLGEYVEKNGIRIAWLSKQTNIPRGTIVSIMNNPTSMPTVDKALKICKVLKVDIETIFPLVLEEENLIEDNEK